MLLMMAALALQAAQPAPTVASPKKEKKVCRSDVATGSHLPHSVCHTRAEWNDLDNASGQDRDHFRDQSTNPGLPSLSGRPG